MSTREEFGRHASAFDEGEQSRAYLRFGSRTHLKRGGQCVDGSGRRDK
jgi:hypothetical protein